MGLIKLYNFFKSIRFDLNSNIECQEGQIAWNSDSGTLEVGMPGSSVCLQLGQEQLIRVKNISGVEIANGTPVYVSNDGNSSNANIEIEYADASVQDDCRKTLAVTTETIGNNKFGFVTTFGLVRDINTDGYAEGDEIFVAVGGGYTNVKPDLPNAVVRLGFCVRQSKNVGSIFINIDSKSVKDILTDSGDLTIKTASGYTAVLDKPVYMDDNQAGVNFARGASAPDLINYRGGAIQVIGFNGGSTLEQAFWGKEFNHDGKEGTDVLVHGHFAPTTTATGDYKFFVDYDVERNGSGQIASGTLSVVESASGVAWQAEFLDFGAIPNYTPEIGDQFGFRLYRDPSDSEDTYTDDVAVVFTFGYHYQIDTLGSRQVGDK